MGIFTGTGLDPANDPTTDVWAATRAEIAARGLEIHGSLTKRNVKDGATAVVLKATETKSGRVVAIKVYKDPNRRVAHRNGDSVPMTNFFENERRMLAGLQSCALVPKYYFSVAGDDATSGEAIQPFHVMEFVEGERITKFAKDSVGQNSQAMTGLFRQVLDAIDTIHRFGYLHRDLSDGNVLVDRGGNIRLIDLAEASPLGEEHTRLISTPGFGTEGVATTAQQKIRKIQTDDVRDACTIGYAMFTGSWKQDGETAADWRRNFQKTAAPDGIAAIIVKGMQARDTTRDIDSRVWNSASEVIAALDRLERIRRFRQGLIRNTIWLTAIAAMMLVFGYFAWERAQQFGYTSELRRLSEQRESLSNIPRETRADARVQQRINAAQELEQQAEAANRQGKGSEARTLLKQAVDKITDAARVANNLSRLRPLIEPLRKILLENDQWNRDCSAINRRLTELGTEYQEIQRQVEFGDPEQAWTLIAAFQQKLVNLIDDNQQSYELTDLMNQATAQTRGLDSSLRKIEAYQQIKENCSSASLYYADGKWREARTELLGAIASIKSFLAKHETEEQRRLRLAANTELIDTQIATNDALQREVNVLNDQIADAKAEYHDVLFRGAQFKKELDTAKLDLGELQTQLRTANALLDEKKAELTAATAERDSLETWKQEQVLLINDYKQRLELGAKAWNEQTTELNRTKELLSKVTENAGVSEEAARQLNELAKAEQAIQKFDPSSWEVANNRLASESERYINLQSLRNREIELGKTDRHADVKAIDVQRQLQWGIVVAALRKRDEKDQEAWVSLESKLDFARKRRKATIDEGWSESSAPVRKLMARSPCLKNNRSHTTRDVFA